VVTCKANGKLELVAVRIDPKLIADGDIELLEDLVLAASNQALFKARESAAKRIAEATGELSLGAFGIAGGSPETRPDGGR
jgi:DNA-binding protein YbaB